MPDPLPDLGPAECSAGRDRSGAAAQPEEPDEEREPRAWAVADGAAKRGIHGFTRFPADRIAAGYLRFRIADIRGPEGTDVTLTVVSPGEDPRDVVLERRRISPTILPEAYRLEADAAEVRVLRPA